MPENDDRFAEQINQILDYDKAKEGQEKTTITPTMFQKACEAIQSEELSESAGFKKWMLVQIREILPHIGNPSRIREALREENCTDGKDVK